MTRSSLARLALVCILGGCAPSDPVPGTDAGPVSACGTVPAGGLPVCMTCVPCGPMGGDPPGCTDGTTRGCWDCTGTRWVTSLIGGCPDSNDAGTARDASTTPDAAVADGG